MKKVFSAMIVALAVYGQSLAQTNTFPTTGNAGIGTTSPTAISGYTVLSLNNNTTGGLLDLQSGGTSKAYVYGNGAGLNLDAIGSSGSMLFHAVGGEVMRINSLGNVGIGTTSPGRNLDVVGAGQLITGTTFFNHAVYQDHTNYRGVELGYDASGQTGVIAAASGGASSSLAFWNYNGSGSWLEMMRINSAGNVGIGTTAPTSLFQVDDGCTKASIGDASGGGLNFGTSYLGFNASRSGTNSWTTNSDNTYNGGGVMYSSIFGDMYFAYIPTTISSSGQTLTDGDITNNIALKISHVDGAVYAKKIYVQTAVFPDYVFKKDYQLMPLAQVKTYIDQNHHLPEMPTEKEVVDKGLDVGEMNKLLTKKVEELTLYLIQQREETDKQNKMQQQSIDELKKQVEALSKH